MSSELHQFLSRIKNNFQSTKLPTELGQYFVNHQFNDWKDIVDDIANGYHDCCCKSALFKYLDPTNIEQKRNEYTRLKQCLESQPRTPLLPIHSTPQHSTPQHPTTQETDLLMVFVERIKFEIAQKLNTYIAKLFEDVVFENEYDDAEAIKEDIDDITNSSILDYIIEHMNEHENIDLNSIRIQRTIRNIIVDPIMIPSISDVNENKEDDVNIAMIKKKITHRLQHKYNETIAVLVLQTFMEVLNEQEFAFDNLLEDIADIDNSEVLRSFDEIKEISEDAQTLKDIKLEIKDIIVHIGEPPKSFDIKNFTFHVTKNEVHKASKHVTTHCPNIYQHLMGIAKTLDETDLSPKKTHNTKPKPKIEGKSLCIAKAIDNKNKKPIMYWLLMLFSKERSKKYRKGALSITRKYTVNDWWNDNKYCQWIQHTCPNIAENIRAGLADLVKRTLPPLNYNYPLFPVICDKYDDFVRYVLAFHDVAYNQQLQNALPMQIDYWIIPRSTKKREGNGNTMPFDAVYFTGTNVSTPTNAKYLVLSEDDSGTEIADIKDILEHRKLGYKLNQDYFIRNVSNISDAAIFVRNVSNELVGLIVHYTNEINTQVRNAGRNRYIIIVDRRMNENGDKMYMIAPKQYRNKDGKPLCSCGKQLQKKSLCNAETKCVWCEQYIVGMGMGSDKQIWCCPKCNKDLDPECSYYLCSDKCEKARPNTFGKLSPEWQSLPESCLSLSKSYILFNPYTSGSVPITLDDALNGYMFGLSYHILNPDTVSVYWYHNAAGTIFQLSDVEKGWPQWFNKINGEKQKLYDSTVGVLGDGSELRNVSFEELERQCINCE